QLELVADSLQRHSSLPPLAAALTIGGPCCLAPLPTLGRKSLANSLGCCRPLILVIGERKATRFCWRGPILVPRHSQHTLADGLLLVRPHRLQRAVPATEPNVDRPDLDSVSGRVTNDRRRRIEAHRLRVEQGTGKLRGIVASQVGCHVADE